jgi:hypothetical protein
MHARLLPPSLVLLMLCACGGSEQPAAPSADASQPSTSPAPPAPEASPAPAAPPADAAPKPEAATLETLLLPDDTLASAQARLGAANVVAQELDGAEGETFPG